LNSFFILILKHFISDSQSFKDSKIAIFLKSKTPTSPQQQKKGKEMRKWEESVDYKTLDYGNTASESSQPNTLSNNDLAAATQYASVGPNEKKNNWPLSNLK
jgi:hypothetical protein